MSARYRKIQSRVFGDHRVRRLSHPQPNAETLWIDLLIRGYDRSIPGLLVVSVGTLADARGWPADRTDDCLSELEEEVDGRPMCIVDRGAGVIWIPRRIEEDENPRSPDNVRHWGNDWAEVPECMLKWRAWEHARGYCAEKDLAPKGQGKMPSKFLDAFLAACPEPPKVAEGRWFDHGSGDGSTITSPKADPAQRPSSDQEPAAAPSSTRPIRGPRRSDAADRRSRGRDAPETHPPSGGPGRETTGSSSDGSTIGGGDGRTIGPGMVRPHLTPALVKDPPPGGALPSESGEADATTFASAYAASLVPLGAPKVRKPIPPSIVRLASAALLSDELPPELKTAEGVRAIFARIAQESPRLVKDGTRGLDWFLGPVRAPGHQLRLAFDGQLRDRAKNEERKPSTRAQRKPRDMAEVKKLAEQQGGGAVGIPG